MTLKEKHAGKKTKNRDIRDSAAESAAAMYRTADGEPGIPAMAFKASLIGRVIVTGKQIFWANTPGG